jgi:hypothetical protein
MNANRQQRRRAEARQRRQLLKRLSVGGPLQLDIVTASAVLDPVLDPEIISGLQQFARSIIRQPRLCLTCPHEWSRDKLLPPPAGFAVVRTHGFFRQPGNRVEMVSGLCESCGAHPELRQRALDAYRAIWPQLRDIDVHNAPAGRQ